MTPKICRTCRLFNADDNDASRGACRANPPKAFLVASKMGQPMPLAVFPPVQADWWCGSWTDPKSLQ